MDFLMGFLMELLCKIMGHDYVWYYRYLSSAQDITFFRRCVRCGKEVEK